MWAGRGPRPYEDAYSAKQMLAYGEACRQEADAEIERLQRDLQYARDGLIRGRTRMREDNERLRAALAELLACHTESAGWCMSMLTDRAEFDAMLARSQERLHAAIGAAREALGPNVRAKPGAVGDSA